MAGGGEDAWGAHGGLPPDHTTPRAPGGQPHAPPPTGLKRRGVLEGTLVVRASEFGRSPGAQGSDGRAHHPYGFSAWMAGGGIRRGVAHGATDELGFHAVEDRHYVTDIHATVLHQLMYQVPWPGAATRRP